MIDLPYLRHKAGDISQTKLAALVGWSRSKVQRHEKYGNITSEDVDKYLKELNRYRRKKNDKSR